MDCTLESHPSPLHLDEHGTKLSFGCAPSSLADLILPFMMPSMHCNQMVISTLDVL